MSTETKLTTKSDRNMLVHQALSSVDQTLPPVHYKKEVAKVVRELKQRFRETGDALYIGNEGVEFLKDHKRLSERHTSRSSREHRDKTVHQGLNAVPHTLPPAEYKKEIAKVVRELKDKFQSTGDALYIGREGARLIKEHEIKFKDRMYDLLKPRAKKTHRTYPKIGGKSRVKRHKKRKALSRKKKRKTRRLRLRGGNQQLKQEVITMENRVHQKVTNASDWHALMFQYALPRKVQSFTLLDQFSILLSLMSERYQKVWAAEVEQGGLTTVQLSQVCEKLYMTVMHHPEFLMYITQEQSHTYDQMRQHCHSRTGTSPSYMLPPAQAPPPTPFGKSTMMQEPDFTALSKQKREELRQLIGFDDRERKRNLADWASGKGGDHVDFYVLHTHGCDLNPVQMQSVPRIGQINFRGVCGNVSKLSFIEEHPCTAGGVLTKQCNPGMGNLARGQETYRDMLVGGQEAFNHYDGNPWSFENALFKCQPGSTQPSSETITILNFDKDSRLKNNRMRLSQVVKLITDLQEGRRWCLYVYACRTPCGEWRAGDGITLDTLSGSDLNEQGLLKYPHKGYESHPGGTK